MRAIDRLKLQLSAKKRAEFVSKKSELSGVEIRESLVNKKGYWLFSGFINYLVKLICVYFCIMGTVECYMSAFNVNYARGIVYPAVFAITALYVILQYRPSTMAAGMLLGCMVVRHIFLYYSAVVMSGISAIVNISYEVIREKFMLPEVDGFEEVITNRVLTINTVVICGCIMLIMLFCALIIRHMSAVFVMLVTMTVAGLGMFFGKMPNAGSIIMLLIGWVIILCLKFNYKYNVRFKKNSCDVIVRKNGFCLAQGIDGLAMLQLAIVTAIVVVLTVTAVNTVYPKAEFDNNVVDSEIKKKADLMAKDVMILGFSRYKKYGVTVKISGGQLGNYSNVSPDLMTDLNVKMVPYTTDRMYLRGYVGAKYENNMWLRAEEDFERPRDAYNMTADSIIKSDGPKGNMEITYVDVLGDYRLTPYYTKVSEDTYIANDMIIENAELGQSYDYTFYIDDGMEINIDDDDYYEYVKNNYLEVPKANKDNIAKLLKDKGFSAEDENLDFKISNFFDSEYEYSLNPGLVPWKTDFVNYFLFQNKVGCCAHFASSATLMYRSLGIPARYVEGYVIDYPNLKNATKLEGESVEDWISGITPISEPMSINVNDSGAHAWVEIYKKGRGWVPVEVTPPDYTPEDGQDTEEFSTGLAKLLEGLGGSGKFGELYSNLTSDFAIKLKGVWKKLVIGLVSIFSLYVLGGHLIFSIRRRGKRINKNIVLMYNRLLKMLDYVGVDNITAYRDLGLALKNFGVLNEEETIKFIRYIEKALFSDKSINNTQYQFINECMNRAYKWCFKNMKAHKKLRIIINL